MYVFALVVSKFMRQVYVLRIAKQITFYCYKKSNGRNKKRNAKDILQSFSQINYILSVEMSAILKNMYSDRMNITNDIKVKRSMTQKILLLDICYISLT